MSSCTKIYGFQPSPILAGVGIGLFTLLTMLHITRMLTTRTWDNIPMILAGVAELLGYSLRLFSAVNSCSTDAVAVFGGQSVLLTIGPTLVMLTVSLVQPLFVAALGGDQFVWVPLRLQRPLYLAINIALLALQTIAATIEVTTKDTSLLQIEGKVLIASFAAQTVFWAFLLAENTYFRFRMGRTNKEIELRGWKWWIQLFGLAVSIIGFGCNLVRLTALGGVKLLLVNEWTFYAFDGYQTAVVMLAWGLFYLPGRLIRLSGMANSQEQYEMNRVLRGRFSGESEVALGE